MQKSDEAEVERGERGGGGGGGGPVVYLGGEEEKEEEDVGLSLLFLGWAEVQLVGQGKKVFFREARVREREVKRGLFLFFLLYPPTAMGGGKGRGEGLCKENTCGYFGR